MTHEDNHSEFDDIKSNEDLADEIQIEIQALGINLGNSLTAITGFLFGLFVLGIIALVHFW